MTEGISDLVREQVRTSYEVYTDDSVWLDSRDRIYIQFLLEVLPFQRPLHIDACTRDRLKKRAELERGFESAWEMLSSLCRKGKIVFEENEEDISDPVLFFRHLAEENPEKNFCILVREEGIWNRIVEMGIRNLVLITPDNRILKMAEKIPVTGIPQIESGKPVYSVRGNVYTLGSPLFENEIETIYAIREYSHLAACILKPEYVIQDNLEHITDLVHKNPNMKEFCWPQEVLIDQKETFAGYSLHLKNPEIFQPFAEFLERANQYRPFFLYQTAFCLCNAVAGIHKAGMAGYGLNSDCIWICTEPFPVISITHCEYYKDADLRTLRMEDEALSRLLLQIFTGVSSTTALTAKNADRSALRRFKKLPEPIRTAFTKPKIEAADWCRLFERYVKAGDKKFGFMKTRGLGAFRF